MNAWQRLRAGLVVAAFLAALGVCVAALLRGDAFETDLLALLPATERDVDVERAVKALGQAAGRQVVIAVGNPDVEAARRGARAVAAVLARTGAYARVTVDIPPLEPELLTRTYGAARFGLVSDEDRAALAEGRFDPQRRLLQRLLSPVGGVVPAAEDPFGTFSAWLEARPTLAGTLALDGGQLVAHADGRSYVVLLAELAGSPFDGAVQEKVRGGFEDAMRALEPGSDVLRTGSVFFAAAARGAAEADVDRIALGSLIGGLLLLYLTFRSVRPLALGFLSTSIGVVCAAAVVLLTEGKLHLITLAFGASLIGEGIDYSTQYFAVHAAAGARWNPVRGALTVRPALTVALASSLLPYAVLGLLPFPGISQIALFALVGMTCSYLSVLWLLPALLAAPSPLRPGALDWANRLLDRWNWMLRGRRVYIVAAVCLVLTVPGWFRLTIDDDVRHMIARDPGLVAEEAKLRALTGVDAGTRFVLVRGATPDVVLEREWALRERLRALQADGALAASRGITDFVPPVARQQQDREALLAAMPARDRLAELMEAEGLRPDLAVRLAEEIQTTRAITPDQWLASPLAGPWRALWMPLGPDTPASAVTLSGEAEHERIAAAVRDLPGVVLVDKASSTSALLGDYRRGGPLALVGITLIIFTVLAARYGLAIAVRVMAPVLLAEVISVGVFGYSGEPISLFAVVGWGLTLGVGVNYAIFLREGAERPGASTAAVLLAAASTMLSFGLLSTSSMPALRQFGLALAVGATVAVLFAPLALDRVRGRGA
jgi:predicted exporter